MRAPAPSASYVGGRLGACLVLLAVLVAFLLVGARSSEAAVSAEGITVSAKARNETAAAVSGDTAVWAASRSGTGFDIEAKNIERNRIIRLPSGTGPGHGQPGGTGGQIRPSVTGRYLVWEDTSSGNSNIYGYDLNTQQAFDVAVGPEDQMRPSVSGQTVVWEDNRNGTRDVFRRNLKTLGAPAVATETGWSSSPDASMPGDQTFPVVGGGTVVFQVNDAIDSDVVAMNLATGEQTTIADDPDPDKPVWQDSPAIGGGTILWREESIPGNYDVHGYDLAEEEDLGAVAEGPGDQSAPAINGRVAVWVDNSPGGNADIDGKDLTTGKTFDVAQGGREQENPAVSGDVVVWETQRPSEPGLGTFDVFGAELDLAPAAPKGLTASGTAAGVVKLDWTPSPEEDLAGYNVYRAASENGTDTQLNTGGLITEPTFEDAEATEGERYFYQVTAVDAAGTESAAARASAVAPEGSEISLSATPSQFGINGGQTTLSGRLTSGAEPLASEDVVLERRPEGTTTWRSVTGGQRTTNANGNFSLAGVDVDHDTDYRAVFGGTEQFSTSTSSLASVDVQTMITVDASPNTVILGRNVTVLGTVLPNKTGEVRLTIERGATTVRTTTVQLSNSRFSTAYRPTAVGTYRVTAAFGSGDDDADTNATTTFRVRQ